MITYSYTPRGLLASKNAAGTVTDYEYDARGRLVSAVGPSTSQHLAYDPVGRLLSETIDGRTVSFTYDHVGNRLTRTTPTGAATTAVFDQLGNRTQLTAGLMPGNQGYGLDFTFDPVGRETSRTFGDGISVITEWDPAGRPLRQTLASPSRRLRDRSYSYRPDGHLLSWHEEVTDSSRVFDLDPIGRPLSATGEDWTESYTYDALGNQVTATWPDAAGHIEARGERSCHGTTVSSAGATRYRHDAAGRIVERIKKRISRKPDVWRYTWDAEDRLISCTTPDGSVWRYAYDPAGRRTAKYRMSGQDSDVVVAVVRFSWDGHRLVEAQDSATAVTQTWDYDGIRPITQYERKQLPDDEISERFFAIISDLVGTPMELVAADGSIAAHARTTCWGTTGWNADATAYTPLRFPGQYEDPETGLRYNVFRHYDPETGRYASPDSLGLQPAPNPAAYVPNPSTWADPSGLAPYTGSGQQKIPVYRGTDRYVENMIHQETGMLMSDAAQRGYMEGGSVDDALAASRQAHAEQLSKLGGEEGLAHAHAKEGTEFSQNHGPKSVMSFTTDPEVAKQFANGGPVYQAMIDPGEGIWQTLATSGEKEVLIPHMIEVTEWDGKK